jgi:hypothetical protein
LRAILARYATMTRRWCVFSHTNPNEAPKPHLRAAELRSNESGRSAQLLADGSGLSKDNMNIL